EVVDCIRTAARHQLSCLAIQDEHWGFARDSRDFAIYEHVGNEITEYNDALAFESIENLAKVAHAKTPERIDSTASIKVSAVKCGCCERLLYLSYSARPLPDMTRIVFAPAA